MKLAENPGKIDITDLDIPIKVTGTAGENDWYTNDITLSAPVNFTIKGNGKAKADDWNPELTISEEGSYDYSYSLKRDGQPVPIEKTFAVKLDKTLPVISVSANYLDYTLTFSDTDGSGIDRLSIDGTNMTLDAGATTYRASSTAGEHTAEVTDKAGNRAETRFTLTEYIQPTPDPVYYNVTLPVIEGVSTDPVAGNYPVESDNSFSFYLTVEEGYRELSQPVVKANGTIVTPRTSDGRYMISYIQQAVDITIEGIRKDPPTANAEIDNGLHVRISAGTVCITTPTAIRLRLTDFSGRLIRDCRLSPGENRLYGIATGNYILLPEGREGMKIQVK